MQEVYNNLQKVANNRSAETERRAGEMDASLRFGRVDDIMRGGLHNYLVKVLARVQDISNRIANDFLVPVSA